MTSITRAWLDRLRTFAGRCSRGIFAAVMVSATSPTPGASGGGVLHEGRDEACTPWARPALVDDAARRLSLNHVLSAVLDEAIEPVRIGRFVLLERLGAGGMGIVYSAYDPQLDRRVAVKLLRADRAAHADDPADRLLREAQAMARLSHPNVVAVHEVGVHEGAIFVAMEFIEGTTLAAWLGTPRSPAEIVEAFLAAGRGLAAAHAAGLVHRDFKPANVLVGVHGRVCVSDFGLVRVVGGVKGERMGPATSGSTAAGVDAALTLTGALVGTPGYMSPEQFEAQAADARSDQFSFCVALYEALHGERPFPGDSFSAIARAVCGGLRRPTNRRRGVAPRVLAAIERGLSTSPAERFVDMNALLRALGPTHRRAPWIAVGLVGAAVAGLIAASLPATSPCAVDDSALAGVWDEGRRTELRRVFAVAHNSTAEQALRTTEEALDAWAAAWSQAQRDACEDCRVRGRHSEAVLDLRTACLDRLRGDFAASVDVLAAGARPIESLPTLLAGLPSLQRCANLELLRQGPRPSADPAAAKAILAEIGRGHALRQVDRADEAHAAAEHALAAATALADGPLAAEARFLRGMSRIDAGEFTTGIADVQEAANLAEAQRHDLLVAEARVELARKLGQRGASVEERRQWFPLARAAVERLGDRRDPIRGMLSWAEAASLETEERWDEALIAYGDAIELGGRAWPDGDDRLLCLRLRQAIVAGRLGRREEAAEGFEATSASIVQRWGPEHRWYANTLLDRGQFEIEHLGEIAVGMGRIAEALAIYRRVAGDGVEVAWASIALAQAAYLQGDYAQAEARVREGLALLERKLGPEHPDTLIVVDNLGAVLFHRGDLVGARAAFTRALADQRRLLGPDHPEVARLESHLGEVLVAEGDPAGALPGLERACKSIEAQHGAVHLDMLAPLKALGLAHLALGDPAAAREAFVRARAVLAGNPGADPVERGEALWGLARAQVALGDDVEAPALAREAERAFTGVHDPRAAEVLAWIAGLPSHPDSQATKHQRE
jgi:tetratricopeptide (TPR) repeat protein/predicted Ser/Thr protein kinase